MTGTTYRFTESEHEPGRYIPFHRAAETRVPGDVRITGAKGALDRFTYTRDTPPPKGKRKHTIVTIKAATVAELSAKLVKLFEDGEIT